MRPVIVAALLLSCVLRAEDSPALKNRETYNLWPAGAVPLAQGDKPEDTPVVQAFLPEEGKATGASFVVCPGGGYGGLAGHESGVVGEWFAKNGITAFVLRYRLGPKYRHPVELGDAQRAIRFVRFHAKNWMLNADKIGILGFSAGGHLTTTAATHFDDGKTDGDAIDKVSCRPNAQVPVYPVVTMREWTHGGSRNNLLAKEQQTPELINLLSNELQVTEKTPPAFVFHSVIDLAVIVHNSDKYVEALKAKGVKHEYIRGEHGPHGIGLNDVWTVPCIKWLRDMGW